MCLSHCFEVDQTLEEVIRRLARKYERIADNLAKTQGSKVKCRYLEHSGPSTFGKGEMNLIYQIIKELHKKDAISFELCLEMSRIFGDFGLTREEWQDIVTRKEPNPD